MSKKYFIVLGLFLVAGFLFLNNSTASATSYTWTGAGDGTTWTDPLNWGQAATYFSNYYPYPGATSTADTVTISSKTNASDNFIIRATSTPAGTVTSIVLGGAAGSSNGGAQLIIGNGARLSASTTVMLVGTSTLKMGDSTWGSGTLRLTNGANNAIPLSIGGNATFTAATGTVTFAGGWNGGVPGNTILIATTTFYILNISPTSTAANLTFKVATSSSVTIGAGGGTFDSGVTFVVASGATLTISGTITATGVTWTNSGTVTEGTGGKITKASASQFDDGSGTAKSSFSGDARDSVYVRVTDTSLNFLAATAEKTQTVTITAKSLISDTETVTLTETAVDSGIFSGGVTFGMSGTNVVGQLDYQGPGTLSYTFTDSQDSSDTGTGGTATFTGTAPGGGGGGGGGGTVSATPATPAIPATPAVPGVTPAVPATPAVLATPSLESVQSKVAAVIARIAALPTNPTASDLTSIQAEIATILIELQSVQAAQPAPQGVALGFRFVRPLALGLRHSDVSNLQEALKTDSSVYPEGLVTGYFGPATLRAIKKFQEKYGIAGSGASGYGNVGPATRAKLNELYGSK